MIFCGAELKSGIAAILDIVRFEDHLESTDLVITGEGAIDGQTTYGKVPVGIAKQTQAYNVPVLAIVGDIVKLYGGSISFSRSTELGGLSVHILLPRIASVVSMPLI